MKQGPVDVSVERLKENLQRIGVNRRATWLAHRQLVAESFARSAVKQVTRV